MFILETYTEIFSVPSNNYLKVTHGNMSIKTLTFRETIIPIMRSRSFYPVIVYLKEILPTILLKYVHLHTCFTMVISNKPSKASPFEQRKKDIYKQRKLPTFAAQRGNFLCL